MPKAEGLARTAILALFVALSLESQLASCAVPTLPNVTSPRPPPPRPSYLKPPAPPPPRPSYLKPPAPPPPRPSYLKPPAPPPPRQPPYDTNSPALQPPRLPQYNIHFGRCVEAFQRQEYGNWIMTRSASEQTGPDSIVLRLDTRNMCPVASAFGTITPRCFRVSHLYFAYFDTLGVASWTPALDRTPYKETTSYYSIIVNGSRLGTVRDMKDEGVDRPQTASYSLKGSLSGLIVPSTTPYIIEIVKVCTVLGASCEGVPDPRDVFLSPKGFMAYSLWTVKQSLRVNGTYFRDHGWCPVQTVINVP